MDLGHITAIKTMASELITRGHDVVAAVKDTAHAHSQLGNLGITWVQAPYAHGTKPRGRIFNHADILYSRGYHDPLGLSGYMHAWASLFNLVKPDRIICDSSPTASLVARSLDIPVIAVDKGFFVPPVGDILPQLAGTLNVSKSFLEEKETSVLEIINKAQAILKYPALNRFSDLFTVPCLWTTWPEISHFGRHNEDFHIGPVNNTYAAGQSFSWKTNSKIRVFAYLKGSHFLSFGLLKDLLIQGCEVIAYLPGWSLKDIERLPNKNFLTASDKPIDFTNLIDEVDFLASHSGIGTAHSFLSKGKPQIMIPQQTEQYLLSKSICNSGMGSIINFNCNKLECIDLDRLTKMKSITEQFALSKRSPIENLDVLMQNLTNS